MRVAVQLARPAQNYLQARMVVFPIQQQEFTYWFDPAGYAVARNAIGTEARLSSSDFQYELDVALSEVRGEQYLRYV